MVLIRTFAKRNRFLMLWLLLINPNQQVLTCKRFSYFRPFTRDIISLNSTHSNTAILSIFTGVIQQVRHLGRGREKTKSNKKWHGKECAQLKKWCPSHKLFYVLFSVTHYLFLLGFLWSPDNITTSNKKNTSRKEPTIVSEITL